MTQFALLILIFFSLSVFYTSYREHTCEKQNNVSDCVMIFVPEGSEEFDE